MKKSKTTTTKPTSKVAADPNDAAAKVLKDAVNALVRKNYQDVRDGKITRSKR
jgi:hypothetical protein